jgi:hypothetical protein
MKVDRLDLRDAVVGDRLGIHGIGSQRPVWPASATDPPIGPGRSVHQHDRALGGDPRSELGRIVIRRDRECDKGKVRSGDGWLCSGCTSKPQQVQHAMQR